MRSGRNGERRLKYTEVGPIQHSLNTASRKPKLTHKARSAKWLIAALLILSAVPLAAGVYRLTELAGGADVTQANARFFASPLPVVLHILTASIYAILSPFQFSTGLRLRRPGWHRIGGRLLVLCGLVVALTGLWMTLFYPRADGTGVLLYIFRLLFGSAMAVFLVLGVTSIRKGDVTGHRAWMMRSYAIGIGAGTQVLTHLVGGLFIDTPTELSGALLMGAGWVINLAVAEWVIWKKRG